MLADRRPHRLPDRLETSPASSSGEGCSIFASECLGRFGVRSDERCLTAGRVPLTFTPCRMGKCDGSGGIFR